MILGTYIPYRLYGHVLIPNMHKNGFYLLGGIGLSKDLSTRDYSGEIREVLCDTLGCEGSFRLIGYFNTPRLNFLAMLVPDSVTLTPGTMSTKNISVGNVTNLKTGRTERMEKLGRQEKLGRLEKPEKTA